MSDPIELRDLDTPPDADTVRSLRSQARDRDKSMGVTYPATDKTRKRFVVSPRGTCVVLNDTREETYNHSVSAEKIAESLRE